MPLKALGILEAHIAQSAKIVNRADYWARSEAIHGPTRTIAPLPAADAAGVQVIQVGDNPDGFGKGVVWDRSSDAILLAIFVNAADPLGVSISGVAGSDYVTISSVEGLASFSQDTGNPLASSIIGVIGAGLSGVLKLTGVGAALGPLIDGATKFAQDEFKPTDVKTKIRDGFGVDPGSGKLARQEGGVLVSLPGAGGPYYSGDDNHKDRWVKDGGSRDDAHRPAQVQHGFFPLPNVSRNTNGRQAGADGEVYITPWDWKFGDNAGYYKVFVIVSKAKLP